MCHATSVKFFYLAECCGCNAPSLNNGSHGVYNVNLAYVTSTRPSTGHVSKQKCGHESDGSAATSPDIVMDVLDSYSVDLEVRHRNQADTYTYPGQQSWGSLPGLWTGLTPCESNAKQAACSLVWVARLGPLSLFTPENKASQAASSCCLNFAKLAAAISSYLSALTLERSRLR
jgi:hypothetical protein